MVVLQFTKLLLGILYPTMFVHFFSGFSTLVSLITMGVGVDTEQKIEKAAKHPWLEDLDQNSLSWSYGIAAISLLPSCLTVIILGWFVYPKK